ncbi:MAG: hypothetical protein AAFX99_34815, partial [Myxococcota bacterium]
MIVLLSGCGLFKSELHMYASAEVQGGAVIIHLDSTLPKGTQLRVKMGDEVLATQTVEWRYPATSIALPLSMFKPGSNTVTITGESAEDGSGETTASFEVTREARDKLFVQIVGCVDLGSTSTSVRIESDFGEVNSCAVSHRYGID